tara:strand:+ start:439 stop:795 length:357 start_codon:yes stop_codon:yes gene_type:complete
MSEEKQMPDNVDTIEDLVQHSLAQDYNKANEVFGNVMTTKLADVLDQTKMKLAGQIYNGDPEDEEEIEDEEDIENEEEVEGEEETEETDDEIEDEDLEVPEEIEDEEKEEEEIEGAAV